MTQQDNGGAAFPSLHEIGDIAYSQGGMTLRDWFAGQALAGYFANAHTPHQNAVDNDMGEYCYAAADALLAARSAK